ncbi:hypothetical protein, partial [Caldivirga sp.]|uniref:hypothetical protein n=1 Tax=Caldivirga sp. TaxID=2080243 RepID=UPI003D0B7EDA
GTNFQTGLTPMTGEHVVRVIEELLNAYSINLFIYKYAGKDFISTYAYYYSVFKLSDDVLILKNDVESYGEVHLLRFLSSIEPLMHIRVLNPVFTEDGVLLTNSSLLDLGDVLGQQEK